MLEKIIVVIIKHTHKGHRLQIVNSILLSESRKSSNVIIFLHLLIAHRYYKTTPLPILAAMPPTTPYRKSSRHEPLSRSMDR